MSRLTGLSIADCANPILTMDQLRGKEAVYNKALVIPMHVAHLTPAIRSVEFVSVTFGASIGRHTQGTDEIYVIQQGQGELWSNGTTEQITVGDLVIAPTGTKHGLRNTSARGSLDFLVIELAAPREALARPAKVVPLLAQMQESATFQLVHLGQRTPFAPRLADVDLACFFTGPWGHLYLVEVPPGGRIEPYTLPHEENLFLLAGHMMTSVAGHHFHADHDGFNAFLPRLVPHAVRNCSSVDVLRFVSVQFPATREEEEQHADE